MLIEATEKKERKRNKLLIIRMSLRNEMNQIRKNLSVSIQIYFLLKQLIWLWFFATLARLRQVL